MDIPLQQAVFNVLVISGGAFAVIEIIKRSVSVKLPKWLKTLLPVALSLVGMYFNTYIEVTVVPRIYLGFISGALAGWSYKMIKELIEVVSNKMAEAA